MASLLVHCFQTQTQFQPFNLQALYNLVTMIDQISLLAYSLLPILFTAPVLSMPEGYKGARQSAKLSANAVCGDARNLTNLCDRCFDRDMKDAKSCIYTEPSQKKPDGLIIDSKKTPSYIFGKTTPLGPRAAGVRIYRDVRFHWHDIFVVLDVNTDNSRRVQRSTTVGPLNVGNQYHRSVNMGDIEDQLLFLSLGDAVKLVIKNARQGEKEARAFLDAASTQPSLQGLTLSQEIEADLKNSTINFLNIVLCKGVGGAGAWIAVDALSNYVTRGRPTQDQNLMTGAIAVLVVTTEAAIVDWLEDVLEQRLTDFAIKWVQWTVLAISSRMREIVMELPPLLPVLDPEAFRRGLLELFGSTYNFLWQQLGLTDTEFAQGEGCP